MTWRRWNWLDDGVLPLALALLRVCWLWPWLALLQRWLTPAYPGQGTLLPVGLVLGLPLVGMLLTRRALAGLSVARARAVVTLAGLVAVLGVSWWQLYQAVYPPWDPGWLGAWAGEMVDWADWETRGVPLPFFALLALGYLWARGVREGGRGTLTRDDVWRTFAGGFVALALVLLVARVDGGLPPATTNLVWGYFAVGTMALALAGLQVAGGLEITPRGRPGADAVPPQLDRYWLGSVLSVVGGLLLVALVLSTLVAPEAVDQILSAFLRVVRQLFLYLFLIVSYLLYPLLYLLSQVLPPVLRRVFEGLDVEFGRAPEPLEPQDPSSGLSGTLDRLPPELRWVALAGLVVVLGLIFALAVRRFWKGARIRDGVEETRESIVSRTLLQEQLADVARRWLSRLRRSEAVLSPFLSLEGEAHTRRVVRAAYQALLAAAQKDGHARPPALTPLEYGRALEEAWPSGEALDVITRGYVQARYASQPPTPEEAQQVRRAWEQLVRRRSNG